MDQSSVTDPVRDLYEIFVLGMRSGDVDRLVSIFADDIVLMAPADRTLQGKMEVAEWYREYFEYFSIQEFDETERVVTEIGSALAERIAVSVRLEAKKGGMPIYDDARILNLWRQGGDGKWLLWLSMWNSVKPIGAGTNRFLVRFMQSREE